VSAPTTTTPPSSSTPPSSTSSSPAPARLVTGPSQAPGSSPLLPIGIGVASVGVAGAIALGTKRLLARTTDDTKR
jgi:hypothetical protein